MIPVLFYNRKGWCKCYFLVKELIGSPFVAQRDRIGSPENLPLARILKEDPIEDVSGMIMHMACI